jgi:hypothetical protein
VTHPADHLCGGEGSRRPSLSAGDRCPAEIPPGCPRRHRVGRPADGASPYRRHAEVLCAERVYKPRWRCRPPSCCTRWSAGSRRRGRCRRPPRSGRRRSPTRALRPLGPTVPPVTAIATIPIAVWEFSLSVYLIVKGFKPSPVTTGMVAITPSRGRPGHRQRRPRSVASCVGGKRRQ